ncbi:hypothetical protein ACTNCR_05890 [Collinsella sp. HCP3S3_A7]|uniref:hypothetical protein n=1 Tax=unclassified Collinsella TaxID=2637548 RepID=UPI003F8B66D6
MQMREVDYSRPVGPRKKPGSDDDDGQAVKKYTYCVPREVIMDDDEETDELNHKRRRADDLEP